MSDRTVLRSFVLFFREQLGLRPSVYRGFSRLYHFLIHLYERFHILLHYGNVEFVFRSRREALKDLDDGFKSQYGQDAYLVKRGLIPDEGGSFVDVGCNDPVYLSNTWHLEKRRGYQGLAIDPLDLAPRWSLERPETKFVQTLISAEKKDIDFYEVQGEQPWHSMMSGVVSSVDLSGRAGNVAVRQMTATPLAEIFRKEGVAQIDVMFVDVEGHELSVLESVAWHEVRPQVLVIENFGRMRKQDEIRRFMLAKGYKFLARIWISDDIFVVDHKYGQASDLGLVPAPQ